MKLSLLRALSTTTWLAVPGIVAGRLLEHKGYGGWAQVFAQFCTTWLCFIVVVRRELCEVLQRGPGRRSSPPDAPEPSPPDAPEPPHCG